MTHKGDLEAVFYFFNYLAMKHNIWENLDPTCLQVDYSVFQKARVYPSMSSSEMLFLSTPHLWWGGYLLILRLQETRGFGGPDAVFLSISMWHQRSGN